MNYYELDSSSFRSDQRSVATATLVELPWPDSWVAGQVHLSANDTAVGSLVLGRRGGSPAIANMTSLSGITVTSADLNVITPTAGQVTIGRSNDGTKFQYYNDRGLTLTFAVCFIG